MVALTGVEPDNRQFSSVQFSLSSCRFSKFSSPVGSGRRHGPLACALGAHISGAPPTRNWPAFAHGRHRRTGAATWEDGARLPRSARGGPPWPPVWLVGSTDLRPPK